MQDKARENVSVKDFGAVGDGVTDDSAAISAAVQAIASAGSGTLRIPKGRYLVKNNSTPIRIGSSIRIVGDGKDESVILFNDSASSSRQDCIGVSSVGNWNIEFEAFGIQGDWGTGNYDQRSHLVEIGTTGVVSVTNCKFTYGRYFALSVYQSETCRVTECEFGQMCADGASIRNCNMAIVSNNIFNQVNDDSIAVHSLDTESNPVNNSAVIEGNTIVDSQGIAVQGPKHISINANVLKRIQSRAIYVGQYGGVEGDTGFVSVQITNNLVDTVFLGSEFSSLSNAATQYICVEPIPPTAVGGYYAGQRNGSGGVVSPYPYFYTNNVDTTPPAIGSWFFNVMGNQILRTLQPVANYSVYGYGQRLGRSGPVDPAITSTTLGLSASGCAAIEFFHHLQNGLIYGNNIYGTARGISFTASPGSAYVSWLNVCVENNSIANYIGSGCAVLGKGTVEIRGNTFNADPLNTSQYRGANGTWTFPSGHEQECNAVYLDNSGYALFQANTIKNVQSVIRMSSTAQAQWDRNTLYYFPNAEGFNTSNKGIGYFDNIVALGETNLVIEECNPNNSGFGEVLNICLNASDTLPSSGHYPYRHFVRNSVPNESGSTGSKYMVTGWVRLNFGNGHVLNTDWRELRALTGN
jgi:hypothetical protein